MDPEKHFMDITSKNIFCQVVVFIMVWSKTCHNIMEQADITDILHIMGLKKKYIMNINKHLVVLYDTT